MFKVENYAKRDGNIIIEYYLENWEKCNELSLPIATLEEWILKEGHNITDHVSIDEIVDVVIPVHIFVEENLDDFLITQFLNEYLRSQ